LSIKQLLGIPRASAKAVRLAVVTTAPKKHPGFPDENRISPFKRQKN
jgi:hypothetical protein